MREEYFIIVSESNEIIGKEKRGIVHKSGLWHRGVHAFLFTRDRRLLVQRRSLSQDTYPGALDCSVSEHLNPGEAYLEGLIRGLREELGLEKIRVKRLLQFMMEYGPNDNMANELFEGVVDEGPLTVDPHEIQEVRYHTLAEIQEMMASERVQFTSWFVQLFRWYTGKPTRMKILWSHRQEEG
jgi:isopentenyl-diphosphate delta-isomerase type 1